jgi:topoisomerase-4 subunit A
VYDALVRLAQDFTMRYPLIDGEGNFGSRDGDEAAAYRYTEARLTRFAEVLLSELDMGTVDFVANYDGTRQEPVALPARLPVVLLNGASGIAVGMATEIPSHNLNEVASAAIAMIRDPELSMAGLMKHIKGPDFPGGGQIITPRAERFGASAGPMDCRASGARAVAAGGARAAARDVGSQGAGGDRRHHQPAAQGGQEIAHARADAREAARALHAGHGWAQRAR